MPTTGPLGIGAAGAGDSAANDQTSSASVLITPWATLSHVGVYEMFATLEGVTGSSVTCYGFSQESTNSISLLQLV